MCFGGNKEDSTVKPKVHQTICNKNCIALQIPTFLKLIAKARGTTSLESVVVKVKPSLSNQKMYINDEEKQE